MEGDAFSESDTALHTRLLSEDPCSLITDIREYDVPYLARVCIDLNIRVGCWYDVSSEGGSIKVTRQEHILTPSNPKVFAFDIECSKAPLKFPNAEVDAIYMISIMIDGRGILIINRDIVSKDINDFEYCPRCSVIIRYTPHPDYKGPFHVYNEPSEEALLKRFYRLIEVHFPRRLHLRRRSPTFSCPSTATSSTGPSSATAVSCSASTCRTKSAFAR